MPYLPVFVLLFLPLTAAKFTTSYLLFSVFNLVALALYLVRFSFACGQPPGPLLLAEWMLCLPLLSNLTLGQINVLLVVCLGEFILATIQGKPLRSGLWLAGLLIKPYVLILLLAGLAVGRRWRPLAGFGAGFLLVSASSMLLAGGQGMAAAIDLGLRFAGPLIQTGPAMMNWRALALNLWPLLPGEAAWAIAGLGMLVVTILTLQSWRARGWENPADFLLLILATLCATFALSWHSHFYLMMLLLPVLIVLDGQARLPASFLAAWSFGLPALYLAAALMQPDLARNILGLGYLALNLGWLGWAVRQLRTRTSPRPLAPV